MELKSLSIEEYISSVAKKSSVPGGGSVLALTNELAAALLLMVCNFTIDKKGYENSYTRITELIKLVTSIKEECHDLIDEDAIVFKELMNAFSSKDEEKISICSIKAAMTPYKLLKNSELLMQYAKEIMTIGNKNLVSDAEIAYDLAKSSISGSLHHIKINLSSIKDDDVKNMLEKEIKEREKNV